MIEPLATRLAGWAAGFQPGPEDLALAGRSLVDTLAVAVAGRNEPVVALARAAGTEPVLQWAAAAHALDYDDLHMESTAHISAVCVCAALAAGAEDARPYLAGAGVMARLGAGLGWDHYSRGWHATCTAGAPAAAVAAGVALGLDAERLAVAMALAIPAGGGVQAAFGTQAKPLQVGMAVAAGVQAARLAAGGAEADPQAVDQWFALMGGDLARLHLDSAQAIPGGLAVKVYPCCYALQRPIAAVGALAGFVDPAEVVAIEVSTPAVSLKPLNRHRPLTGLAGKFSLEYGVAAALLDRPVGFATFTDAAVRRETAQRLLRAVRVEELPGGDDLLAGEFRAGIRLSSGEVREVVLDLPPGAPSRPPDNDALMTKVVDCCGEHSARVAAATWADGAGVLRALIT